MIIESLLEGTFSHYSGSKCQSVKEMSCSRVRLYPQLHHIPLVPSSVTSSLAAGVFLQLMTRQLHFLKSLLFPGASPLLIFPNAGNCWKNIQISSVTSARFLARTSICSDTPCHHWSFSLWCPFWHHSLYTKHRLWDSQGSEGWWQSGGQGPACTQTICSHPPARDPAPG